MNKRKLLFSLISVMMIVGLMLTCTTSVFAEEPGDKITVKSATVTSETDENGAAHYKLNVTVTNGLEKVVGGKTVGLAATAALGITSYDEDAFGFADGVFSIGLGKIDICLRHRDRFL